MIILTMIVIGFHINQEVYADAANQLQMRLNKINSFSAYFIQKIISVDGDLIQRGEGRIWMKRPNLFKWHMFLPDESWLVSDGINLWFYNSFIEQVTVTLLSDVMTDMPFILIIRNNPEDWKRYHVSQNGDNFSLKVIKNKQNLKHFLINIKPNGILKKFTAVELNGQISSYEFQDQKNSYIHDNNFKFVPPHGVTFDDQRSSR